MKRMSFETLMDILDWFDDGLYDYLNHILLTRLDGEARIRRAMPEMRKYARALAEVAKIEEALYEKVPEKDHALLLRADGYEADFYRKDAMQSVHYAQKFFGMVE